MCLESLYARVSRNCIPSARIDTCSDMNADAAFYEDDFM